MIPRYLNKHWRDIIAVATVLLVMASLLLIAYEADASRRHVDCIVKLLATPSGSGQTRHIVDLSVCKIEVSPR